ncbi:MAG: heme exporter protein CcmB, partial [Myxococcota bacterium]|nr:heme exporter protein CcmB [Myxococcota bacterium]
MSAGLLRRSWCILEKDLRLEWRSREVVYSAAFFALIVALVFAFGVLEQGLRARMASAALWVCLLFAGSNALQRSFEREREGRVLRALLLTGRIGWPLFIAKVASNFLFLSLVLGLAAPLGFVLLGAAVPERPWAFAASLLLGAAAFATVGTLVSAMVGELRLRALLFPVVLFPLMIPIFVLGVSASSAFM